jgi:hypothetical protein
MCQQQGRSELRDSAPYTLLADTERLILAYSTPISISALQVYHSAVATMPSCLLWETLGQHYVGIPLLVSQRATGWGPRVKIIYGNAFAAVFSPDNRYILSRHGTAQLWDAAVQYFRCKWRLYSYCVLARRPECLVWVLRQYSRSVDHCTMDKAGCFASLL